MRKIRAHGHREVSRHLESNHPALNAWLAVNPALPLPTHPYNSASKLLALFLNICAGGLTFQSSIRLPTAVTYISNNWKEG